MTHPTDADVEAMARAICRAIGVPENALCAVEGEPFQPCWEMHMPKARAGLMALPHYLRAVEEREGLIEALESLAAKLEAIGADKSFLGIWGYLYAHNYKYTGPNWNDELAAARAILSRAQAPTPVAGEGETK